MEKYIVYDGPKSEYFISWYRYESYPLLVLAADKNYIPDSDFLCSCLEQSGAELLMGIQEFAEGVGLFCYSITKEIKAIEFLDFVFGSDGSIKGDCNSAYGKVPEVLLHVRMSENIIDAASEYFMKRAADYFLETDCVQAVSFVWENREFVSTLPKYCKKPVRWAYVKSLDIAPAGTTLILKSLEGEAGVTFCAAEDMYVMIGCLGEVYEIAKMKFEKTYQDSGESLDIFETCFDFLPAVEIPETGEYCAIDEFARICFPKPGNAILASALKKRTKIYRKDSTDYFVGNPGDYMVIRTDDEKDIYIIQKEVFMRTYEVCKI